jgi:hypothetical protein
MANALNQDQLSQIVAAVTQALQVQGAAPKAAPQPFSKFDAASKDRQLVNTFTRRGFKNVVLMDRSDKAKEYNVRPYKGWIELGRVVRHGERGVRGLFHIDQTDVIPAKPEPKAKKGLFKAAKPQPRPAA